MIPQAIGLIAAMAAAYVIVLRVLSRERHAGYLMALDHVDWEASIRQRSGGDLSPCAITTRLREEAES